MLDNGKLYKDIIEKLDFEEALDTSKITIAVKNNGVVLLGGEVNSYMEKRLTIKAVEKVRNVREVIDALVVNIILPKYKRSDAEIAQSALSVLKCTWSVPYDKIKV